MKLPLILLIKVKSRCFERRISKKLWAGWVVLTNMIQASQKRNFVVSTFLAWKLHFRQKWVKNIPLDILETHAVSNCDPIPMKIGAATLSNADNRRPHTFSLPLQTLYTNQHILLNSNTYLIISPWTVTNLLLPSFSHN